MTRPVGNEPTGRVFLFHSLRAEGGMMVHRDCAQTQQIANWLRVLLKPGQVVELRALGVAEKFGKPGPHSGFFDTDHLQELASAAAELSERSKGVYWTLNPVNPDLLARRANRVARAESGDTTSDADILRRRWLLVDCDPKRAAGISATDDEKEHARQVAVDVDSVLFDAGWPASIMADSGNGYHLLYRIDLPADDGELLKRCLHALAKQFDNEHVGIDTSVFNPSRICKLYGTMARKGDHIPARPHRRAKILNIPNELAVVSAEKLEQLAAQAPVEDRERHQDHAPPNGSRPQFKTGDVLDRARRYLAKIPPAIAGQHGHDQTFHAACCIVQRFDLSVDDALPLLAEWNAACQPPWSEHELRHKLEDAAKQPGPRGELLDKASNGTTANRNNGHAGSHHHRAALDIEPFRAFPVAVLPQPLCEVVNCVSKAMGCDPSFVALPALSVLAGVIGNSRRIRLKRGWTESAIVWTAIVGESGTLKSPPLEWLTQPLRDREETALERYATELEEFQAEKLRHDAAVSEWKKKKSTEPPPIAPAVPVAQRSFTSDATIEAVAVMLADNPRGMSLIRDELAGWVSSFDQYKKKGGNDAGHWLAIHSAKGFAVDRKTGDRKTIYVPQPAMSAAGGTQPATLRRVLFDGHIESGLAARLLFAYPPRKSKRWTEAEITPEIDDKFKVLIDGLFALQPHIDDAGKPKPVIVGLTPAAKELWVTFYNEHSVEQSDLAGDLAAAWSKLECYAARLALVVHCVRVVTHDLTLKSPDVVDETSITAGITMSRWFGHEAKRVYAMLHENEDETEQRQLVEWIRTRGGTVTARDLQRGPRRFRNATAEFAEAEINKLVGTGLGVWEPIEMTPAGGHPSRRFRLHDTGDGDGTQPNPDENASSVAVATPRDPEIESPRAFANVVTE